MGPELPSQPRSDRVATDGNTAELGPRPVVPLAFVGYCKKCHYNLRGLNEPRCPECGRPFLPGFPSTYDLTPAGGPAAPSGTTARTSGSSFGDTFRTFFPPNVADQLAALERRVGRLSWENAHLEHTLQGLVSLLASRGIIRPDDVSGLVPPVEGQPPELDEEPPGTSSDGLPDEAGTPLSGEPDVEMAALMELQKPADRADTQAREGADGGAARLG
jgi:hypothetical protein